VNLQGGLATKVILFPSSFGLEGNLWHMKVIATHVVFTVVVD